MRKKHVTPHAFLRANSADSTNPKAAAATARFQQAQRLVWHVTVLHVAISIVFGMAIVAFRTESWVAPILNAISDGASPFFGLLRTMRRCPQPPLEAIALSAVMFTTGHLLIAAYVYRGFWGIWSSYLHFGKSNPAFEMRAVDWLFWSPAAMLLGVGVYAITYVHMRDAASVICTPHLGSAWFFRIVSTSLAPFFFLMVSGPLIQLLVLLHHRSNKHTN